MSIRTAYNYASISWVAVSLVFYQGAHTARIIYITWLSMLIQTSINVLSKSAGFPFNDTPSLCARASWYPISYRAHHRYTGLRQSTALNLADIEPAELA